MPYRQKQTLDSTAVPKSRRVFNFIYPASPVQHIKKLRTFAASFRKGHNTIVFLPHGVMVALQILVLLVWVRVLVRQQKIEGLTESQTLYFLPNPPRIIFPIPPHIIITTNIHHKTNTHFQLLSSYINNQLIYRHLSSRQLSSSQPPAILSQGY